MQTTSGAYDTAIVAPVRKIRQRVVIDFVSTQTVIPDVTANEGDDVACPKENIIDGKEGIWGTGTSSKVYAFPDYYNETGGELFTDDFETGDLSLWDTVVGGVTVQDVIKYGGTYGAKFESGGEDGAYITKTLASFTGCTCTFYIYFDTFPVDYLDTLWGITSNPVVSLATLSIIQDGHIGATFVSDSDSDTATSSEVLSEDTWYKIVFTIDASSTSTHTLSWTIDDVAQDGITIDATTAGDFTFCGFNASSGGGGWVGFIDDTILETSGGGGSAFYYPSDYLYPVPANLLWEGSTVSSDSVLSDDPRDQYELDPAEVIALDFGSAVTLSRVQWVGEHNSKCYPSIFTVEYYDGDSWEDVGCGTVDGPTLPDGDVRWEYELVAPVQAEQLRMTVSAIEAPKQALRISEFGGGWPKDFSGSGPGGNRVVGWEIIKERTTESEQSAPLGNSSSNVLTLQLDNTDGVFYRGSGSEYAPYLKANRPITVTAGLLLPDGTEELLTQGTFYSVAWDTDQENSIATVTAWDKSKLMKEKYFSSSEVYEDYTISDLVEMLCDAFGLAVGEYEVDETTDVIPYSYFAKKSYWEHLVDLAVAEGGAVYFNEENVLIFENRTHLSGGSSLATLTDEDTIISMAEGWEQNKMRNRIEVHANPLTPQAETTIYTNIETVTVPGLGTKTITVYFPTVPCMDVQEPDITGGAHISIDSWTAYAWGGTLVLANSDAADEDVTEISIDGKALIEQGGFVAFAEDTALQKTDGVRTYEINSPYIQTLTHAQAIADDLLAAMSDPGSERTFTARGRPELQLGDLITVTNARMDVDADQWIQRIILTYDGGLQMEATVMEDV